MSFFRCTRKWFSYTYIYIYRYIHIYINIYVFLTIFHYRLFQSIEYSSWVSVFLSKERCWFQVNNEVEEGPCLLFLPPASLPRPTTHSLLLRNGLQPLLDPRGSDPCFTLRFVFLDVSLVGKHGHNPSQRWAVHFVMSILIRAMLTWIRPCHEILQNHTRKSSG